MNTKRYTWNELVYKKVAKKILEFRQELKQVTIEEICKILGIPAYVFTRLGNERYWFTEIPPKYWETLHKASNNLFIEGGVIKDHRKKPVKIIQIEKLKVKKGACKEKVDSSLSSGDFKTRTYTDPKSRKEIHVVSPENVPEINSGDQETSIDKSNNEFVKKETSASRLGFDTKKIDEKIDYLRGKVLTGNFEWFNKGKELVKFVEDPNGMFKVYEKLGWLFPMNEPGSEGSEKYTPDFSKPAKVELSARALGEIDDQVRRIIREEVPGIVEKAINNIKFEVELPVKIKS